MGKSKLRKSNRISRSELEELLNDGKESKYWSTKPKPRKYKIENEKVEEYYDNLVLDALKKHDNICGRKFGKKVCFQKHCSHNQDIENEDQQEKSHEEESDFEEDSYDKEDLYQKEDYPQEENFQEDNYQQKDNPINLLVEAIKFLENKEEEKQHEIIKLVDYESTDNETVESPDTIESESEEEELFVGQAPMYLPLANFFENYKKDQNSFNNNTIENQLQR